MLENTIKINFVIVKVFAYSLKIKILKLNIFF